MEAMGAEMAVVKTVLSSHDDRISSLHKRVGEVQVHQSDQQAEIKVLSKEVEEARQDIAESKKDLTKTIEDQQKASNERMTAMQISFDKKFETLTGAVRWGTGAVIAAIGVMIPLLLNLH